MQADSDSGWWPAPAKLNLFLSVLGRRADGYHELQTLFQILDWGDQLRITINNTGMISRHCNHAEIPASKDICVRAARLLQTICDTKKGAHIELIKHIPVGAGLGGGSSDAATVLLALNELWCCGLPQQQLAELGLQLGADVPVFIDGHSAWAQGRGEKLQAVSLGDRHYVLVFPEFGISTAEIFAHAALKRNSAPRAFENISLQAGDNDCLSAAQLCYPELKKIMQDLQQWSNPHMSGTGSTIFLPFDDKKSAIKAAQKLKCRYNVRVVGGVDRSPLLNRLSGELKSSAKLS